MWTVNSLMFKLVLEKAEEPEIKLPTSDGSSKKQESSRKTSISALLTMLKPLTVWIITNCGKFWKRWEYQTTFTYFLRNLYAGQEATARIRHGPIDLFQIEKGVHQDCIMSPCLFNSYAKYIMQNSGLDEAQVGIKIARKNINNLRNADDTTLMAENKELRVSWWKWKRSESEKVGLKLNIQKTKIMASGPSLQWQIDGETMERVPDFILGGFKITADGDCSHEIKRCLLIGSKAMTSINSILKSRDITLPTHK